MFAGLKAFFRKPFNQALVLFLGGLFLYAYLGRPVEYIQDFAVRNGYAYLASYADGLRVLSLTDPENMNEVGSFLCETPIRLAFIETGNILNCVRHANSLFFLEDRLFMTDHRRGLFLFDISMPDQPKLLSRLPLQGAPQDVVAIENRVYVAAGRRGLWIVEVVKDDTSSYLEGIPGKGYSLKQIKNIQIEKNAFRVFTNNQLIFVSNDDGELFILDKDGEFLPNDQGPIQFEDNIYDMKFDGNLAYLAVGSQGLFVKTLSEEEPYLVDYSQLKVGPNEMVVSVDVRGNNAYLAIVNKGLVIADITDPQSPKIIQKPFSNIPAAKKVIVNGNTAYVTDGFDTFYSLDARVNLDMELVGKSGEPLYASGIVTLNNLAYVAAGERGLRVINLDQPGSPREVAFADTAGSSVAVALNPPIAYLADRNNGLVSIDITNPAGVLPRVDQDASKDARDIVINSGNAYLADYEEGLKVYSLSYPRNPQLIGSLQEVDGNPLKPLSISSYGDYVYLSSGSQGVDVVNIIDPRIPTRVQVLRSETPSDAQYTAVFGYDPRALSVPGQDPFVVDPRDPNIEVYAYVANGVNGLQIWKVTDPKNRPPVLLDPGQEISSLTGLAKSIYVFHNRAYLAYDGFGIYVLDISQPEKPVLLGKSELTTSEKRVVDITANSSIVLTANLDLGVSIFNVSDPANINIAGIYNAPSSVRNLVVEGDLVYTVDGERGLWVYDVSNPKFASEVGFLEIPRAAGVDIEKAYAYIAARELGLFVIDLSNPRKPSHVSNLDTDGEAIHVLVSPDANGTIFGYLADGDRGLAIINLDNAYAPTRIALLPSPSPAIQLAKWNDYLFIALNQNGLASVNIVKPDQPVLMEIKKDQELDYVRGVSIFPPYAFLAGAEDGTPIYDVSYPLEMKDAGIILSNDEWIEDTATNLNYLFLARKDQGIQIFDITDPLDNFLAGEWNVPSSAQSGGISPDTVEIVQVVPVWMSSTSDDPGIYRIYIADIENGFFIVDGVKKAEIKILDTYQTFGTPSLASIRRYLGAQGSEDGEGLNKSRLWFRQFFTDVILFGIVAGFLWLGFMAMFILPIERFVDWENLYSRLIYYLFGRHGVLLRIREGKIFPAREDENNATQAERRPGPGTLVIDSSSAVVLEKRNPIGRGMDSIALARVACAGVVFTGNRVFFTLPRYDELLRGIVDLRPQIRLASDVRVYTRDGIELETVVFSIFAIGERPDILTVAYAQPEATEDENQPMSLIPSEHDLRVVEFESLGKGMLKVKSLKDELDEDDRHEIHQFMLTRPSMDSYQRALDELTKEQKSNGSPYSCDPVRVFQAVYAQAVDVPEDKELDWSDLPNLVTIGLLRDLLAREVYDHLYIPMHPVTYPISKLRYQLRVLARNQGVLAYRLIRPISEQPLREGQEIHQDELLSSQVRELTNARNNTKILRTRGIKVRYVGFTQLRPVRDEVRMQFLDYWRARRQREADFILGDLELRALRLRNQWRAEAQKEILNEFINILDANPNADQALAMHVMQALEAAAADPDTRSLLPEDTIEMLRSLRAWLRT